MINKIVEYRGNFCDQRWIDTHYAYYITTKEEFIQVIWHLANGRGIISSGGGDNKKEHFFDGEYKSYLMSGSVKDFMGEDWYIFDYIEYGYDPGIFLIKLETIKERYTSLIREFS